MFIAPLLLLLAGNMPAQVGMQGAASSVVVGTVAAAGPLGPYYSFKGSYPYYPPSSYTIDWSTAGTASTACTFQVEGSTDHLHWYALTAATDCTAGNMIHIAYKPVIYVRLNILTYTAADGSTAVTFNYTRGQ